MSISYIAVIVTLDYIITITGEIKLKMMLDDAYIIYSGNGDFKLHNNQHR